MIVRQNYLRFFDISSILKVRLKDLKLIKSYITWFKIGHTYMGRIRPRIDRNLPKIDQNVPKVCQKLSKSRQKILL